MLPLEHVKMLDLSRQLPGPFCSTLLADLGMDVLTIARPKDPFGIGIPFLARNKRSMTLNLKAPAGRDIFLRLAETADVVLEGFRPGVAARLGVEYEQLRQRNPRLIYCAISGYGQDGPYRDKVGHDINYLGYAGILNFIGEADRPPALAGVPIADIGAGSLMAAVGILTAIIARERTGEGQLVDVAMLDGAVAWNVYLLLMAAVKGKEPTRGGEQLIGYWPCYNIYETRDARHVTVGAYEPHFWATLCRHFGREDFIPDQWAEGERREEMFRFFRAAFRGKTLAEWMADLSEKEICFGPVNRIGDLAADPQIRHRQMLCEIDTPAGRMRAPAVPIKLSATPGSVRTPPSVFGADTDRVLSALGFGTAEIAALREAAIV